MLLEWLKGPPPGKQFTAHYSAAPTKTAPMNVYSENNRLVVEYAGEEMLISADEDLTLTMTIKRLPFGGFCVEAVTCVLGKTTPPSGSEPPLTT